MSAPSATNVAPPGRAGERKRMPDQFARDGEPDRNGRAGAPDRYAALKRENDELRERVDYLENVNRFQDRYARLGALAREYALDPAEEIDSTLDYSDDQFNKHVERIPQRYQRIEPRPEDRVPVDRNSRVGPPDRGKPRLTNKQHAMVARYCADHGKKYDQAVVELRRDHAEDWAAAGA